MSYRQLPPATREHLDLKALGRARDYRAKYPFKSRAQIFNEQVAHAFKILDEKTK